MKTENILYIDEKFEADTHIKNEYETIIKSFPGEIKSYLDLIDCIPTINWPPTEENQLTQEQLNRLNFAISNFEDGNNNYEDDVIIKQWAFKGHPLCQLYYANSELISSQQFESAYYFIKSASNFGLSDATDLIQTSIEEYKSKNPNNEISEKDAFIQYWSKCINDTIKTNEEYNKENNIIPPHTYIYLTGDLEKFIKLYNFQDSTKCSDSTKGFDSTKCSDSTWCTYNSFENITFYIVVHAVKNIDLFCTKLKNERILEKCKILGISQVPRSINNVGIFFPKYFLDKEFFERISSAHKFQELTESNKPKGQSLRKGIYLSNVELTEDNSYKFNLLRCSTNFEGPTENFRQVDKDIIQSVNKLREQFYPDSFPLNHVLAQIYENKVKEDNKERKGSIKAHSDKTKDMPDNGVMAFTTFYTFNYQNHSVNTNLLKTSNTDMYDMLYGDSSIYTSLKFRLKPNVNNGISTATVGISTATVGISTATVGNLKTNFTIKLYPNSVFLMPLETNRLYTHEISPSCLPIQYLPIRLGYVIRCSKTEGIHKNGETFIRDVTKTSTPRKLEPITQEDMNNIKALYKEENMSINKINYNDIFVSMNEGDYLQPCL